MDQRRSIHSPTSEVAPLPQSLHTRPHWRPWREVATLGLICMELCWVIPWYRSLTPATYAISPGGAFLVFGAIWLLIHLTVRLMNYLHLKMELRRTFLAILLTLVAILTIKTLLYPRQPYSLEDLIGRPLRSLQDWSGLIPDEFLIILIVLFIGWRAIALTQTYIGPQTVISKFQLGILMLLFFILINTTMTGETLGGFPYLYLFCGLTAMGAARIAVLGNLRGGRRAFFDRYWGLGMVLAALLVVALASLVAHLAIHLPLLQLIVGLVMTVVALLAMVFLSPLLFFLPFLLERLKASANLAQDFITALEGVRTFLVGVTGQLTEFLERSGIVSLALKLKPVLLWSVLLFIAFLVVTSVSRWLWKERGSEVEERKSVWENVELWEKLRELMQDRLHRLGRGVMELVKQRSRSPWLAAARIRRIYAQLMTLSERLGAPRRAAQTPLEYLPTLQALFPSQHNDLQCITQAYLQVRYGEIAETAQAIEEVEAAWQRVQSAGQQRLNERSKEAAKRKDATCRQ